MAATLRRPCPCCHGDGYHVAVGAPGQFDRHLGTFMPSETLERCPRCHGDGEVAVCPRCLQATELDLITGRERCGCASGQLREAA